MSWIMGTASGHIDLSNDLVEAMTGDSLATVAVASGGSSYVVGDILTIVGGTFTIAAQVEVTSVSGGVIDGVRIYNAGVYTVAAGTPNSATGGSGSGVSLTITSAANGWTTSRDQVYSGSEREVVMEGEGGGADEIFVGWRTYSDVGDDYYNLELHGMTGYSSGLDFDEQPGISPGFFDGTPLTTQTGAYLIASSVSFNYFLNITPYRVTITVKVGSAYMHGYIGWGNRFATSTEYPYPMVAAGCCAAYDKNSGFSTALSTLVDPWVHATNFANGPMMIYGTDGTWYTILNRKSGGVIRDRVMIPCQQPAGASGTPSEIEDRLSAFGAFTDIILSSGTGGATNANLLPTPDDDYRLMLPAIVVFSTPSPQVLLELDDVYWIHAFGGITSEDRFIDGSGVAYRIFQNCNRTDNYAYLAIKES